MFDFCSGLRVDLEGFVGGVGLGNFWRFCVGDVDVHFDCLIFGFLGRGYGRMRDE